MIFVRNGYTKEELQEIKDIHREFVEKAKDLVEIYEKLRSNLPEGDYDYQSAIPFSESLVTPYERIDSLLRALACDELTIIPLKTFNEKYKNGDEGLLDLFYDKEILEKRNKRGVE